MTLSDSERDDDVLLFANTVCGGGNREAFHYLSDIPSWIIELYWKLDGSTWLEKKKEA